MLLVIAALGCRSSILVGIAIPSSFIATILIFNMMGYALNIVLMFGLIWLSAFWSMGRSWLSNTQTGNGRGR